jgi:hypothetical protein
MRSTRFWCRPTSRSSVRMTAPEIRDIEAFIAAAETGAVLPAPRGDRGSRESVASKRVTALERRSRGATLLLRAARRGDADRSRSGLLRACARHFWGRCR